MENKYQNGKIYKISDIGNNKSYYGSTILPLNFRFTQHKYDYSRVRNGMLGRYSACDLFDEYQFDNCKIELVEMFPCSCKTELLTREGYYIKNNDCVNKKIAGRTIHEYQKQYYQKHKERINNRVKARYRALTILKQNEYP